MAKTKLLPLCAVFSLLTGCGNVHTNDLPAGKPPQVTDRTLAGEVLSKLPAPSDKVPVALYDFQDQTGQFKYNDKFTDYSSAVTKGGLAILTKALLDSGNKKWFTVTERGALKDLLQERQIIKVMRNEYHPNGEKLPDLPPLIYAGMLIEGGIISYDSNLVTGGLGAIYLGVGGNAQYHRDMVTVYLRAISIQTGEVLLSVTSSKTIYSTNIDSNVLKYITYDRLFQAEAGFSVNEPVQLCVRQAIETAVYSMIMEGAIDKMWDFKDPVAGQRAINEYLVRRDGHDAVFKPAPEEADFASDADQAPVKTQRSAPIPVVASAPVVKAQPVQNSVNGNLPNNISNMSAVNAAPTPNQAPNNSAAVKNDYYTPVMPDSLNQVQQRSLPAIQPAPAPRAQAAPIALPSANATAPAAATELSKQPADHNATTPAPAADSPHTAKQMDWKTDIMAAPASDAANGNKGASTAASDNRTYTAGQGDASAANAPKADENTSSANNKNGNTAAQDVSKATPDHAAAAAPTTSTYVAAPNYPPESPLY